MQSQCICEVSCGFSEAWASYEPHQCSRILKKEPSGSWMSHGRNQFKVFRIHLNHPVCQGAKEIPMCQDLQMSQQQRCFWTLLFGVT